MYVCVCLSLQIYITGEQALNLAHHSVLQLNN